MKKIRLALIATLGTIITSTVAAQAYDLYSSSEGTIDFFGFYSSQNKDGHNTDTFGPGAGMNYFFTRNFGAGAETYADAFEWPYLLNVSGIFRYPISPTLAPYAYAGGGRQWEHASQWLGFLGAGMEYRLPRMRLQTGIFGDVRVVFPSETRDFAMIRFGLRFKFR